MKVKIRFETTDSEGDVTNSESVAVLTAQDGGYRLSYAEDLSGEGHITKSVLSLTKDSLRITRSGELNMDFMYGNGMVHNTIYNTPYGPIPVSVVTEQYAFSVETAGKSHMTGDVLEMSCNTLWIEPDHMEDITGASSLPDDFVMRAEIGYHLDFGDGNPLGMNLKLTVTK